jgi:ADP-heptose:LPS heptosyltransferase
VTGAQLLVIAGGGTLHPFGDRRPITPGAKRILFVRFGGFGDLVLMTPVLRAAKALGKHVAVCTMVNHYGQALQNLPFVDEIVPYPLSHDTALTFDAWVFYENAVERNPRAREIHMTDVFAEIAGVAVQDKKPAYAVKASEALWCEATYPRLPNKRRVAMQAGTSAACRTYPKHMLGDVALRLLNRGFEVMLLGERGEVKTPAKVPPGMHFLCDAGLTFRQSCAVVNSCDAFVGSDSALLHVAGALDVPAVGLYGPFPWKIRTAYSPSIFALQGQFRHAACPCFHHVHAPIRNYFPPNCPSGARGVCEVLESITPERVASKVEQVAGTRVVV